MLCCHGMSLIATKHQDPLKHWSNGTALLQLIWILGDQKEAYKAPEETLLCRLVLTKSTWHSEQARQQIQASQGFLAATASPVYAPTWQLQQAPVLHHMHYTHGDGGLWPLQTRLQDASIAGVGTQPHL